MGVFDRLRRTRPILTTDLPTVGSARALLGAAARVELGERTEGPRRAPQQAWQADAWTYRDVIGEVRYGIDWLASVQSRVRLLIGVVDEAREEPVDVEEVLGGETKLGTPLSRELIIDATEALSLLGGGASGWGGILSPLTVNSEVPGECFLLGREEDAGQRWEIRSIDELTRNRNGRWVLSDAPQQGGSLGDGAGEELDPDRTYASRLWQPHPRWRALADSPMRGVLDPCEALLLKTRKQRVRDRARLSRGVLLVAQELTFEDQLGRPSSFQQTLQAAMIAAVQDESAPSTLSPIVARVPAERIKEGTAMQHVDVVDKDDESKDSDAVAKIMARIVRGLDFPPEVVEGLGDVKFANAIAIDSTSFRYHIEPKTQRHVDNLTIAFLWPYLEALGHPVEQVRRLVIWYDPTAVVTNPNRLPDVKTAFDSAAASIAELREAAGLVGDGPTWDELWMRAVVLGKVRRSDLDVLQETPDTPGIANPTGERQQPPALGASAAILALTAAAQPTPAPWSRQSLALDLDLRGRLTGAADAALRRALDRAGARVVSRVRKDSDLAAKVAGQPLAVVPSIVGRDALTAAGEDPDALLAGAFDPLRETFLAWTTETWEAGLAAACTLLGLTYYPPDPELGLTAAGDEGKPSTGELGGIDQVAARSRFAADAIRAADGLVADLTADARRRLFDPGFSDATPGEGHPALMVSPGTVRAAMSRAGGAASAPTFSDVDELGQSVNPSDGDPGLVATGPTIRTALTVAGVPQYAYRWTWGGAARPFQPHKELDGRIFGDQTDAALRVSDAHSSWLPATSYRPGDHKGCTCSTEFLLADPFAGMDPAEARTVRAFQKSRDARGRYEAGAVRPNKGDT